MDFFELNKIAGAVLSSLLVLLGVGMFLVPALYAPNEPEQQAYIVEGVEVEGEAGAAEPEPELPIEALIAEASVSRGERMAGQCKSCHTFEQGGANKIGPNLWNIMGAAKAHLDNFDYSPAMESSPGQWTWESMNAFLLKPSDYIPGTAMTFNGIASEENRAAVMVYLASLADSPYPKPEVPEMAAPEGEGEAQAAAEGTEAAEGEATEGEAPAEETPAVDVPPMEVPSE